MIETPAGWDREKFVRGHGETVLAVDRNRHALKSHPQVFPHGLHALVLLPRHPWQHGVAREKIRPLLERLRNLYPQLKSMFHDGRARIRREDIGPEFSARIAAANIHDELDTLPTFRFPFARVGEDHVERRPHSRCMQLFGGRPDRIDLLEGVLAHQLHYFCGPGVGPHGDLAEARPLEQLQFFHCEAVHQVSGRLNAPIELRVPAHQPLGDP